MYNTTICVIVVIMLTSTVAGARPHNSHTNGQTREQYCRQLVGPERGRRGRKIRHHAIANHAMG